MSGPQTPDPDAGQLPAWQAERLALLIDALGGPPITPISNAERDALTWLAGFERHTAEHLAGLLRRMTRRSTHLANKLAKARQAAVSRHTEADRYRHQLADLCARAGIDPGEDPHAALVTHLQRRQPSVATSGTVPLAPVDPDGWVAVVGEAIRDCWPEWSAEDWAEVREWLARALAVFGGVPGCIAETCPDCGRRGMRVVPGQPGGVQCEACSASWTHLSGGRP